VSIDFLLGKKALRPQWAIQLSFGLGS
jgi:hypothetical protein